MFSSGLTSSMCELPSCKKYLPLKSVFSIENDLAAARDTDSKSARNGSSEG